VTEQPDRSRRALLTGRFARPAAPPAPPLGPSPPWLAGRISPAACRDCGQPCVSACPERIIALHPDGHPLAGQAFLDFHAGPCTFCRACLDACPEAPAERPAGRGLAAVELDPASCLATRGIVCVICVAKCPERALSSGASGHVTVNGGACTGCGACVPACPVAALQVPPGAPDAENAGSSRPAS
jgi:ferredoxin-type protein NapF